jgi:hypothetical protein
MIKAFDSNDVNVGDEVAVNYNHGRSYRIVTITSKTPSGRIRTNTGGMFNPDGRERGGNSFSYSRLEVLTDDLRAKIIDQNNTEQLRYFDKWKDLTPDQRARIVAILKEPTP